MATRQQLEQWLHEGILAAKDGQREQARFRLLDVVEQDQANEAAWFWLYRVFDHYDDKRICLENLITINPQNRWAQEELRQLAPSMSPDEEATLASRQPRSKKANARRLAAKTSRPVTLKLVTAFWFGISLTFLGGGIIAAGNWLISGLRSRTFPNYITGFQAFELLVAITFVLGGILGLYVASLLYSRATAGFYGSILLALGLLLVGPIASLIVDPPNYLTMICTGGISGMIVLLTLAGETGFKETE